MYKCRVLLTFHAGTVNLPLTYNLIKRFDIVVNILQAKVYPDEEGQLIVEMQNEQSEHIQEGIRYLESEGVTVQRLDEALRFDSDLCFHCGACTGVCKGGALTMAPDTWELVVAQEKCLFCGLCIDVCPVKALSLEGR